MSDTVYVVSYSEGEYSDRQDWPGVWYPTQAEADAHAAVFNGMIAQAKQAFNEREAWPATPADRAIPVVRALAIILGKPAEWPYAWYDLSDINDAYITPVPRGTLPLHGLTDG